MSIIEGGGIYIYRSYPNIENCIIFDNESNSGNGGGIYSYITTHTSSTISEQFEIINTKIYNNIANNEGGGIYIRYDRGNYSGQVEHFPKITNSLIFGNASIKGGGIFIKYDSGMSTSAPAYIINSIIYNNVSSGYGGGIYVSSPSNDRRLYFYIINSNIYGNDASNGGGICSLYSKLIVTNSILWSNSGKTTPDQIVDINNTKTSLYEPEVSFSNIQYGYSNAAGLPGVSIIASDPRFVNPDFGNFRLLADSSCIDSGTAVNAPLTDIEGNPRPLNNGIDIGAYEIDKDNANNPPIADAGADQSVFDKIILDGNLSFDPDNDPISYQWVITSRYDSNYYETASGLNPEISGLSSGFYDVTLSVSDNSKAVSTDTLFFAAAGKAYTQEQLYQAVADAQTACDLIVSSRDLTILELNEEISTQNEIMSTMYTQDEYDIAVNKAKGDADMFVIPVRVPCPE